MDDDKEEGGGVRLETQMKMMCRNNHGMTMIMSTTMTILNKLKKRSPNMFHHHLTNHPYLFHIG